MFIHEHNMCALASLSLIHSDRDRVTAEVEQGHVARVCRLLLILNDNLVVDRSAANDTSLQARRRFAVDALYRGQFNLFSNDLRIILTSMARLRLLLTKYWPSDFPADAAFKATTGIGLETYFDIATVLVVHMHESAKGLAPEVSPWTSATNFWVNIRNKGDEFRSIIRGMVQTPERFDGLDVQRMHLDFEALQEKPLIEARPGELVAPIAGLVLRHLLSYPVIALSNEAPFRARLGNAYESYAHGLLQRLSNVDPSVWSSHRNVKVGPSEVDSLLVAEDVAVVIEHKSGQLTSTLGNLRVVRSALGPSDSDFEFARRWPCWQGALGACTGGPHGALSHRWLGAESLLGPPDGRR